MKIAQSAADEYEREGEADVDGISPFLVPGRGTIKDLVPIRSSSTQKPSIMQTISVYFNNRHGRKPIGVNYQSRDSIVTGTVYPGHTLVRPFYKNQFTTVTFTRGRQSYRHQ
jgi:hypothetical protein